MNMSIVAFTNSKQSRWLFAGSVAAAVLWSLSQRKRQKASPRKEISASEFPVYEKECKVEVEADSEAPIRLSAEGCAADPALTVCAVFAKAAHRGGDQDALCTKVPDGEWNGLSWHDYHVDATNAARSLIALGVEQFDSVAIIGFNSAEWIVANMAAIQCGAKAAGIYTTNEKEAAQYIVRHSGAKVVFTESAGQSAKFKDTAEMPSLRAVVQWGATDNISELPKGMRARTFSQADDFGTRRNDRDVKLLGWTDFMALPTAAPVSSLLARINAQRPGQCCTLIYTSGTTGPPKAVMCSHDNFTWTAKSMIKHTADLGIAQGPGNDSIISYLPLSHVAAQLLDIHLPMAMTASTDADCSCALYFARPDALKGTLGQTLAEVSPTMFLGVPRVWEKIQEKLFEVAKTIKGPLKKVSAWAKVQGLARATLEQTLAEGELGADATAGGVLDPVLFKIANALVLKKIKAKLGLTKCKIFASAAAPMAPATQTYFASLYIPIMDMYGMSECTGPATMSLPSCFARGASGIAIPGMEMRLDHLPGRDKPGEGEVCYRGRNVMMGYLRDPAKTREAVDSAGWLHSGDIGRVDSVGMLRITGRAKELLITAGGENVAPVPIEDKLKELLPAISNAMVVGDRRKFLAVAITLRCAADPAAEGGFTSELAGASAELVPGLRTAQEAGNDLTWHAYLKQGIDRYNNEFSVSRAQRVQAHAVLPTDFSVPGGELTPTMKLKRLYTCEKYAATIEQGLYGETSMRKNLTSPSLKLDASTNA